MPAKNPRINLTIPHDLDQVISDLSTLQKRPKAQIITEMLLESQPVLTAVRDALLQIQSDQEKGLQIAKDFGHRMILDANQKLGYLAVEVKDL